MGTFFADVEIEDTFTTSREVCDQLRHQVTTVVVSTPMTSQTLQGIFKGFNLPYLTTSYQDHCRADLSSAARKQGNPPQSDQLGISLLPDVVPAIADTIDNLGWTSIIFVYDSDAGAQKWQRLLAHRYRKREAQTGQGEQTAGVAMRYAKRVASSHEANEFLRAVDLADHGAANKHVILDVPFTRAKEIVVQHAKDAHIGKRNFHFIFAQPVVHELQHQLVPEFNVVNITAFKMTGEATAFRSFFDQLGQRDRGGDPARWAEVTEERLTADQALLHDAAQLIVTTYKDIKSQGLIHRKYSEIIESFLPLTKVQAIGATCDVDKLRGDIGSDLVETISRHIRQKSFQGLTGKVEFNQDGCRKNFVIDVIRLAKDGKLIQFAQWEAGKGFSLVPQRIDRQRERKVNKERTYIISTLLEEPFLFETEGDSNSLDPNSKFQGYLADLAAELSRLIGFRYELRVAKDGEVGSQSSGAPGGWGGVVGEILREEADFGLVSRPQSKNLRDVVEYSRPFMYTGIAALASKKATPDCIQILLTFLKPFGWPLWIMIASSFGVVFVLMFIFSLCVARADSRKGVEHNISFCDDLYNSLNFTVDAFTPHYIDSYYARSIAGRLISNFWWVFILLVFSAYTAQLVPLLKNGRATLANYKLTNISQLAHQEDINFGFSRGSVAEQFFHALRTNDSLLENVAHSLRSKAHSEPIDNDDEGINRVRDGNGSFVFFMDSNLVDFVNTRAPCDTFRVDGPPLGVKAIGAILPKDSSYLRQEIDQAITKLYERGTLDSLREKWWMKKSNCSLSHRDGLPVMGTNIHLYNFIGILAIPCAGIAVGFVLAFLEICYRGCTRGRRLRQLKRQQLGSAGAAGETGADQPDKGASACGDDPSLNLQPAYAAA